MNSTQFPWLSGLVEDYEQTDMYQWGRDILDDVLYPLAEDLEDGDLKAAGEAALTIGSNMLNTSLSGLGALVSAPAVGLDQAVAGLDMRTNPENPNYNPLTPVYTPDQGSKAESVLKGVETLTRPLAAAGPAMGEAVFDATGNPELATAARMVPETAAGLFGMSRTARNVVVPGTGKNLPLYGADPRLPNPNPPRGGVTGRGGPGKWEEGAIKVKEGTPDNPVYERAGFNQGALWPREQMIRRTDTPDAPLVPNIPEALQRMERYRPAQGNAWYKELLRQGVVPAEISFFGLDWLKDNEQLVTKEEVMEGFNQSQNDLEAWRSSTTGNVTNQMPWDKPDPDEAAAEGQAKLDAEAFVNNWAEADYMDDATTADVVVELQDGADAAGIDYDYETAASNTANVRDLIREADSFRRNPSIGTMRDLRAELNYHWNGFAGTRDQFNTMYGQYVDLLDAAELLYPSRQEDTIPQINRQIKVGKLDAGHENYSRIPDSLSMGITRYLFPSSEYGNVGQKGYRQDITGQKDEYRRTPTTDNGYWLADAQGNPRMDEHGHAIEVTDDQRSMNYVLKEHPDYEGMPFYGTVGTSNMHYEQHNTDPMIRAGSQGLTGFHARPSRHALYPEQFMQDAEGNNYVETIGVAEELQNDALQKLDKWQLSPEISPINKNFDIEKNKEALEDNKAMIRDLEVQRSKTRSELSRLFDRNAPSEEVEAKQKRYNQIDRDIDYLREREQAILDERYRGMPDFHFTESDQAWKLLAFKDQAYQTLKQGDEWVTMPIPWSAAQAHGAVRTIKGVIADKTPSGKIIYRYGDTGRTIPQAFATQIPENIKRQAAERAEEVRNSYTEAQYIAEKRPRVRKEVERRANQKYDRVEPQLVYHWKGDDPSSPYSVKRADQSEMDWLRRNYWDDIVPIRWENSIVGHTGGNQGKLPEGFTLDEMREDYVDRQMAKINDLPTLYDVASQHGYSIPDTYQEAIFNRSKVPYTGRWVEEGPHKNIAENAERDQIDVMHKFLRDLGFSPEEYDTYMINVPMRLWGDREMIPAIRLDGEVGKRMEEGIPLFNRLPDVGPGREARRSESMERRRENPESYLYKGLNPEREAYLQSLRARNVFSEPHPDWDRDTPDDMWRPMAQEPSLVTRMVTRDESMTEANKLLSEHGMAPLTDQQFDYALGNHTGNLRSDYIKRGGPHPEGLGARIAAWRILQKKHGLYRPKPVLEDLLGDEAIRAMEDYIGE